MFFAGALCFVHVQKSSLEIDTGSKMQIAKVTQKESEASSCEERGRESTSHKAIPKISCLNIYTAKR